MQLERVGSGIALLTGVILLLGLVFNEPSFLFAAFSLVLFVSYRYLVFMAGVRSTIPSVSVERKTNHNIVRQGSDIRLESTIAFNGTPSLQLAFEDILPEGALLVQGSTMECAHSQSSGACTLHYAFKAMNTGELPFGGLGVTARDLLFSEKLRLADERYCIPEILVYPVQLFDSKSENRHALSSPTSVPMVDPFEVQYFREYQMGDAPKSIDWKLSAKYGKIFIREYAYYRTSGQLFIVDLPDRGIPENHAVFGNLKEALICSINAETKENIDLYLVTVSGANLISAAPMPHDFNSIIFDLNRLKPEYRRVHLYRTPLDGHRAANSAWSDTDQEGDEFSFALGKLREAFAERGPFTPFQQEISSIFQSVNQSEVNLFTTFQGDDSHVGIIMREAATCGKHVHLFIPKESYSAGNESRIKKMPFRSVTMV